MTKPRTEMRIKKKRRHQKYDKDSGMILVPLLHKLFEKPLEINSETDVEFLHLLAMKMFEREMLRKNGDGVFSPSGLASCLRRVYLQKNWMQLGLKRVELPAIEPHFYFFTGNFLHLKWQFALYKLSHITDNWKLLDVEYSVTSKRKDHGGTIDVLGMLYNELVAVDIKGLNVRNWQSLSHSLPHDYRIQLADYGMLFNSGVANGRIKPDADQKKYLPGGKFPKIKTGILLAENKGGPDYNHPAALTEHHISIKENSPDVRARLEILREHEEENTIPEIECESTRSIQFTGCPFADYCEVEVKKRQREITKAKAKDSTGYRLATPKRSNRSRRSRS